jgi:histidinol-phosphatase (PHP family)
MKLQDLHTHSLYDDGKNTLADMVRAAKAKGLSAIGLSGHSPLPYESGWGIDQKRFPAYLAEAFSLRAENRGDFRVYAGLEWDVTSPEPPEGLDYVIGSVHHLPACGERFTVDDSKAVLDDALQTYFGGDARAMERAWYAQYGKIAESPRVDVVGHFDLITKYDEPREIFSMFPACAEAAMESLVKAGKIFEINTGAITRGCRKTPYPSEPMLRRLRELDGKITLNSDAHSVSGLAFAYGPALALAQRCGFTELWQFDGREFAPVKIET